MNGADLALVATGIGATHARDSARRALDTFPGVKMVISTGVAGALSEGLRAGDLVMIDRLILGGGESSSADQIVPLDASRVRVAEQTLRSAGLRFATGAMLTATKLLADSLAKRRAKEQSGAIAVDMESAVLALEAGARGIPFVCVRSVLDAIDDEIPAMEVDAAGGEVRPLDAAGFLLRHPAALLKLPLLMRNLSRATASLAQALEALVPTVI